MPGWFPRAVALAALVFGARALAQCTDAGGPGTPCSTDATCCLSPYVCGGTECCSGLTTACANDAECCQGSLYGPAACARANGRGTCCSTDGGYCYPGFTNYYCCPGFSCQADSTSTLGGYTCQSCGLADQATCTKDQDCCSGSCKGTAKVCCEGAGQPCRDSLDCCGQLGSTGNPALSCSAPEGFTGRTCCNRIKGTPCSSKAECCSGRCIGNKCA